MLFIQTIIQCIASTVFLLRKRAITKSDAQFIVFTGTSGKTTARQFVAHGLRKLGMSVISPRSGYTNELGIVLASLGISDISILSGNNWRRIINQKLSSPSFICVELGADCYTDIPWFLKRFIPYAVIFTDMSDVQWARKTGVLRKERRRLMQAIDDNGFVIADGDNTEAVRIVNELKSERGVRIIFPKVSVQKEVTLEDMHSPSVISVSIEGKEINMRSRRYLFEPHQKAMSLAIACVAHLCGDEKVSQDLFLDYSFDDRRLATSYTRRKVCIIADIYKAVPYCTRWFLNMATLTNANKKILVLSQMRPYVTNDTAYYDEIGAALNIFQRVYYIGSRRYYRILAKKYPGIIHIHQHDYQSVARNIIDMTQAGDVIFLKGAFRYELGRLRDELQIW